MTGGAAWRNRLVAGAAVLALGGSLAAAATARLTGYAAGPPAAPVIASALLQFSDLPDGGVAVRDARTQALVATVPARGDGFLRMTLRLLDAARVRQDEAVRQPFLLTEENGGRFQLRDPATGQLVELEAFGPSNIVEFSQLLAARS